MKKTTKSLKNSRNYRRIGAGRMANA